MNKFLKKLKSNSRSPKGLPRYRVSRRQVSSTEALRKVVRWLSP